MQLDRTEFLRLTALLALASCERPAKPPTVPVVNVSPTEAPPIVVEPAPAEPACSNATGSIQACERVGPGCEGLADECKDIGDDFRPRVAERFAECFANTRRPTCRGRALGACMRAAVESACVEPGTEDECRDLMKRCHDAGTPPKYTLETCAKILSAVRPDGDWADVDRERLGPSAESGACTLLYVLPYQPWGHSWR